MAAKFTCRSVFLFSVLTATACTSTLPSCLPPSSSDIVYIVGQSWHAEIGIPVEELGSNLALYRNVFSGAHVLMFGYGKKTFFTAPPNTLSEYFLGPVPGPAVIHVVGLSVTPTEAYPPDNNVILQLPPGGAQALSDYIWNDLTKDDDGKPQLVARSTEPDGLFYAANSEYSLFHTCNTWTADALHKAGLPLSSDNVVLSYQAMNRVIEAAKVQCPDQGPVRRFSE